MPSAGAARCSAAPFLSESLMGVIDDTGLSILSNTYGRPSRHSGRGSKVLDGGLSPGVIFVPFVLRNLSAISLLPTGIFLLLSVASSIGYGWRVRSRIDVSVQQWDIAPSFSRLHRISSRATVRRNAGEPFLLVRHCSRAATPAKFLPSL